MRFTPQLKHPTLCFNTTTTLYNLNSRSVVIEIYSSAGTSSTVNKLMLRDFQLYTTMTWHKNCTQFDFQLFVASESGPNCILPKILNSFNYKLLAWTSLGIARTKTYFF
jgi:hypothetical protein